MAKLPTSIDHSIPDRPKVKELPGDAFRSERFSAHVAKEPQGLADQLTRMQHVLQDAHALATGNPIAACQFHDNVKFLTSGDHVTISHGLGRRARWVVVGWRDAAGTHDVVEVEDKRSKDLLILASNVAGTADVLIF